VSKHEQIIFLAAMLVLQHNGKMQEDTALALAEGTLDAVEVTQARRALGQEAANALVEMQPITNKQQ
jgi:hypothetical protein